MLGVEEGRPRRPLVDHIEVTLIFEYFYHFGEHLGFLTILHVPTFENFIPSEFIFESFEEHWLPRLSTHCHVQRTLLAFGYLEEVLVLAQHSIFINFYYYYLFLSHPPGESKTLDLYRC